MIFTLMGPPGRSRRGRVVWLAVIAASIGLGPAAAARRSTRAYGEVSGPGGPAFGIHVSNQGRFMIVAGGLPLFVDEQIVGGVGCSSGSPDQDEVVAQAGIDAFLKTLA